MKKKILCSLIIAVFISACISDSSQTPPPTDVTYNISIGLNPYFSAYEQVDVNIVPKCKPYDFNPDNIDNFLLSNDQKSFLLENGFVVVPSYDDVLFYKYYKNLKEQNIPIFVTTDSILSSFHILYDYSLRIVEQNYFYEDLIHLTLAMRDASEIQYLRSSGDVKDAAKINVAFYNVALKLLDPDCSCPSFVVEEVQQELGLIEAASGISYSPLFGLREDYSQYRPRGHYTRTNELGRYFKAMMWYGRMPFRLKEDKATLAAILTVLAIQDLKVGNESAIDVWDMIYQTTSFFVGEADDLTIYDYSQIILEVYGQQVPLSYLGNEKKLLEFKEKAKNLRNPKINSSVIEDYKDLVEETKGFRFMGQRFILDSYIFSQLVYKNVTLFYGEGEPFTLVETIAGPIRGFPRGLDVFSVLGFDEAEDILIQEGDTSYVDYNSQVEKLREEFKNYTFYDWTKNIYASWLYCLKSFPTPVEEGWPAFMASGMWHRKELFTALGSWTQLRHDTILYAKQSYTFEATAIPPIKTTKGYVEPNPYLYARLLSLVRMAKEGLSQRGILLDEFSTKFDTFDSLLSSLLEISEKEINGKNLTEEEYDVIENIGAIIETITTFSSKTQSQIESEADKSNALIADVHTDVNSGKVLEEGIGYPFSILVVVNVNDRIYIVKGPVFSYFEFKHPLDDRLTDEKWQEMLKTGDAPGIPGWAKNFVID
ncbi:MAG: DUF3160 domain-containing protein [Candidatus Methanofastidiosia archaeon]